MIESSSIKPVRTISAKSIRAGFPVQRIGLVGHQFCGLKRPPKLTGVVELQPEPDNPADANAVVILEDGVKVGYVPKTSLPWVHALLSGYLTQLRDCAEMHVSEMPLPLLVTLVEPDDLGVLYGCVFVVGLDSEFQAVDGSRVSCVIDPIVEVPRHVAWRAEIEGRAGGRLNRLCQYAQPVSRAMVYSYLSKNWKVITIEAVTTTLDDV